MLINCDIGERGVAHSVDDLLMTYVDIANIACGGHSGNKESVEYYMALALKHNVKATAHLSYPDKENFGRVVLDINSDKLLDSLDEQYSLLESVKAVKLHGALYNKANVDAKLSKVIVEWFVKKGIKEVLTQQNSQLDIACKRVGIEVIEEAFLDRRYIYENDTLKLAPRSMEGAVIHNPKDAKEQLDNLKNGYVSIDTKQYKLHAKTLCIHSDSPSAIEILNAIKNV